jgi:hypothetical protein
MSIEHNPHKTNLFCNILIACLDNKRKCQTKNIVSHVAQNIISSSPRGCRPIGKCGVNGRKYVKEVSSSILTPIYLCSMLAGCVAHLEVIVVADEYQPCVTRVREPRVVYSSSIIYIYIYIYI